MEIAFQTAELRDICEKRAVAIESLGPVVALELEGRLADIDAADTMDELFELYRDDLVPVSETTFKMNLAPGTSLILRLGNVKAPQTQDGGIDWSRVTRLQLLSVETENG